MEPTPKDVPPQAPEESAPAPSTSSASPAPPAPPEPTAPPAPPAPDPGTGPDAPAAAPAAPRLEAKLVAPARGWQWVLQGFALFRPFPAFWVLLLLFYVFLFVLLRSVPVLGQPLVVMLVPALAAGYMVACHAANYKLAPLPLHLFIPLRHGTRAQVSLGIAYLACMSVLMLVSRMIGGEVLFRIAPEGMSPIEMRTGGVVALALYTPVMLAFWFAPALCFWTGTTPAKALFFSFFASWRNRGAFLVYGLGWSFFGAIIPMLAGAVLGAVLPADPRAVTFAVFLMLPYMIAVACAIMTSFYPTYIDVFGAPPAPKLRPAPPLQR